jgi:hypothetical protein
MSRKKRPPLRRPAPPPRSDVSLVVGYLRELERYASELEQEVARLKAVAASASNRLPSA